MAVVAFLSCIFAQSDVHTHLKVLFSSLHVPSCPQINKQKLVTTWKHGDGFRKSLFCVFINETVATSDVFINRATRRVMDSDEGNAISINRPLTAAGFDDLCTA